MPENPLLNARPRVDSVDLLRGAVMALMALDHVRDCFSQNAFRFDPTDLTQTSAPLFLTRWVTHFCAPVFVFLAGTGAYLSLVRGKTKRELSRFLVTRGIWLVILDPTIIRQSWFWDFNWHFGFGQVIWAIGWSMLVLAVLIHLPRWAIVAFGLVLVSGHNLLDGVKVDPTTAWGMLWSVLHVFGVIEPMRGFQFWVLYPLIPWLGVMALGYAIGPLLQRESTQRRRGLLVLGLSLTAAFVVLRWSNVYGDPRPWSPQKNAVFTFFSFLNCQKYPPSLLYLLMTLGPAIAALSLMDQGVGAIGRPIILFGRVPMFFYLIHVPFIHLLAGISYLNRYGSNAFFITPLDPPPDFGYRLPIVYAVWIGVMIALYFPCRWFAGVKSRRKDWWLSYL